ncbi:hypothetical protein, partial [Actinomadura rugatobispora]
MPAAIALVVAGRCRPSPDRVPEGASPDRDTGGIVSGHLSFAAGEGLAPVFIAPDRGVRRVHRDDGEVLLGGHRDQSGFEPAGRECGDELPESLLAAMLLAGLLGGEVQVLDTDRRDTAPLGPVQQPADGVPHLGVAVVCGAGQVVAEAFRVTDRV